MRSNDITALHGKTVTELETQLKQLQKDLAQARIEKAAGKLANVTSVSMMQDDVARIKTIIHEKELAAALAPEQATEATKASK